MIEILKSFRADEIFISISKHYNILYWKQNDDESSEKNQNFKSMF